MLASDFYGSHFSASYIIVIPTFNWKSSILYLSKLTNNSHKNCKNRFGLGTELKVFWSAMSGRDPLLGVISERGLDPDGCLVQ